MKIQVFLRAAQVALVPIAAAITDNATEIGSPWSWIASAVLAAFAMAISEILAGYDARAAYEAIKSRTAAAVKRGMPWWWGLVNRG